MIKQLIKVYNLTLYNSGILDNLESHLFESRKKWRTEVCFDD
jgi:hypothetical protein